MKKLRTQSSKIEGISTQCSELNSEFVEHPCGCVSLIFIYLNAMQYEEPIETIQLLFLSIEVEKANFTLFVERQSQNRGQAK